LQQSAEARHFAFMDERERRPLLDEIAHARPLDGERATLIGDCVGQGASREAALTHTAPKRETIFRGT